MIKIEVNYCNLIKINNISKWCIEYIRTCKYFIIYSNKNTHKSMVGYLIVHNSNGQWLDSLKRLRYEL